VTTGWTVVLNTYCTGANRASARIRRFSPDTLCEPGKEVKEDDIRKGVQVVLAREASAYTALWESLTINQRRFLRGLAVEDHHVSPYSSNFLQKNGLGHPSSIQRLSSALLKRDVIDRKARSFIISDRFLRIWIREREE
jgi:uncharacterized protein